MEEWETLEGERAEAVMKALSHPKRKLIYDFLASGPARQHKLAKELFPQPPKSGGYRHLKYSDTLLRHHLIPLKRAGLIDFYIEGREKYVRRALDVRVQARVVPEWRPPKEAPKTREEAAERVRELLTVRRR